MSLDEHSADGMTPGPQVQPAEIPQEAGILSSDDTQPCQPPTLPSFDELQGIQEGWSIDLDAEWLDDDDAVDSE